jgi:histidyl-tRNA synthetase
VLVALADEEARPAADAVAATLRGRGIAAEVAPDASKYGKQIKFAERRGIPFVWFDQTDAGTPEVRDIRSGDQVAADAQRWAPPAADLLPTILTAEELP